MTYWWVYTFCYLFILLFAIATKKICGIKLDCVFNFRLKFHNSSNVSYQNGTALLENRKDHEPDGKASLSGSVYDKSSDSQAKTPTDVTYASQLSLENPAGFSRDAFGRQSMSEKRHATLDAKSTDTYQKSKKIREERMKKEGTWETFFLYVASVWIYCANDHFHVHHVQQT